MIALPSIAFEGFSGSAKGVTARQVGGRSILSCKSYPTGYVTVAQVIRRSALSKISKAYKNLSEDQMKSWELLAEQSSGQSVFGQKAKISAHNLFVRLNTNRAYCGENLLLEAAPVAIASIPAVEFSDYCISEDCVVFTGVPDPEGNLRLVAKMSDGQSTGVSNAWSKTVIIAPDRVPDWGDIDLTDAFADVMGSAPVNGQKYFVELYWIDPDTGFTGFPVRVSRVAQPESASAGVVFKPRIVVRNEAMLDNSVKCIDDLDMEFAPGSALCSLEIRFDCTGQANQEAACDFTDKAHAKVPNFKTFALGRSGDNTQLIPHFFQVIKQDYQGRHWFRCTKRAGFWNVQGEVFGTGVVFNP